MNTQPDRRETRHRGVRVMAAIALVGTALAVAGASAANSTFALWKDSLAVPGATITAGSPQFTVIGLEGLNFAYGADRLSGDAVLTIANTGNTELHGFSASAALADGTSALFDATSITLTPFGGGQSVSVSDWAETTRLAPNDSREFTITTSVATGDLATLADASATTTISISARIGTSWTATASGNFAQSVGSATTPEPGGDDFNTTIVDEDPWDINIRWENPPNLPSGFFFYSVYINGIFVDANGNTAWPQFNMGNLHVPVAARPPVGETAPVVVTVVPNIADWDQGPIAQRTIWVQTQSDGNVTMSSTPPTG